MSGIINNSGPCKIVQTKIINKIGNDVKGASTKQIE